MNQYEVTFIVDPVLSGDEMKATAQSYVDHLKSEGSKIVHMDEMGLKQLAYPINNRTSGVYYCIEFLNPSGELISKLELALRRDERIMRFLTVRLDKYGVKYNDDKRKGLIGVGKKKTGEEKEPEKAKVAKVAATSTTSSPPESPSTTEPEKQSKEPSAAPEKSPAEDLAEAPGVQEKQEKAQTPEPAPVAEKVDTTEEE